jgi:hypothetical protein
VDGPEIPDEELFAKDTKGTTLLSVSKSKEANAARLLLPKDVRYTIQHFHRLFLKPKMEVSKNIIRFCC